MGRSSSATDGLPAEHGRVGGPTQLHGIKPTTSKIGANPAGIESLVQSYITPTSIAVADNPKNGRSAKSLSGHEIAKLVLRGRHGLEKLPSLPDVLTTWKHAI